MKRTITAFCITLFCLSACSDDSGEPGDVLNVLPCYSDELEVRKNFDTCQSADFFLVCASFEVESANFLAPAQFDWIPMACDPVDHEIIFENAQNQQTSWRITDKDHFIRHEQLTVGCSESIEHINYVCQKNEVIYIDFLSEIFGSDTIHLELYTAIVEVKNEQPLDAITRITLGQPRARSNIPHFYYVFNVEDKNYDHWSRTYHSTINLLNTEYHDVIELKLATNIQADPHTRIYMKEGYGVLGFELSDETWIRSN